MPDEDVRFEDDSTSGTVDVLDASVRSSYNKFKGKSVDVTATDFSDRLGRSQQRGYKVEPEDMEMISVCREPETLMQRYCRLKHEVTELLSDVQKIKSDHTATEKLLGMPLTDMADDVQQLQKQLLGLQMDQSLSVPLVSSTQQSFQSMLLRDLKVQLEAMKTQTAAPSTHHIGSSLYEVYTHTETEKFANLSKLSELEERLRLLEGMVGKHTSVSTVAGGLDAEYKDIFSAVLNLQAKVALLDIDHVDAISSQLQRLIALVDEAQTKAKSKLDDKKVSDALQTVTRLWSVAPMVPDLVNRLHSLKELHERAAQFAGSVTYMASTQDEIDKQITSLQGLLNQVQESLQENLSTVQVNLASLESRINALK